MINSNQSAYPYNPDESGLYARGLTRRELFALEFAKVILVNPEYANSKWETIFDDAICMSDTFIERLNAANEKG